MGAALSSPADSSQSILALNALASVLRDLSDVANLLLFLRFPFQLRAGGARGTQRSGHHSTASTYSSGGA